MQLLKVSDFLDFHLKAFTQRHEAVKVAQRKAKNFAAILHFCVRFCFLSSGLSGSELNKAGIAVVLFIFNVIDFTLAEN